MIGDLIRALEGQAGRVELRGLVDTLRRRWRALAPASAAREATAADGRALARAIERVDVTAEEIEAAADVYRRWHWGLFASDEVLGRPTCSAGCADRLVLRDEQGHRCALCDGPVEVAA